MISRSEILMGRDTEFPLSIELEINLRLLFFSLNAFRTIYGKPMTVSSGYRPSYYNKAAHGAPNSLHRMCLACDFHDLDGSLASWILANKHVLEECCLYLEDPAYTKGWVHLQVVAPRSGNRVFKP